MKNGFILVISSIVSIFLMYSSEIYALNTTDSTLAIPQTNESNISPRVPMNYSHTNPVAGDYSTLPGCPGDPSRMAAAAAGPNAGVTWPAAPRCPDTNENFSATDAPYIYTITEGLKISQWVWDPILKTSVIAYDSTVKSGAYCPNQCTVTRYITRNASNVITNIADPICPAGYYLDGEYNVGPEYQYVASPAPLPPATTIPAYYQQAANATCNPVGTAALAYTTSCGYGTNIVFNLDANHTLNTVQLVTIGSTTAVGQYTSFVPLNGWAAIAPYCQLPLSTVTNNQSAIGCSSSNNSTINCDINTGPWRGFVFTAMVNLYAQFVQCTPKAGYYPTGYNIPTSYVCTRVGSHWSNKLPTTP
jgi:hypothetical protein